MTDEPKSVKRLGASHGAWRWWSPLAFLLGGVAVVALVFLILFAQFRNQPVDSMLQRYGRYLAPLIGVLLLVGMTGLYVRYGEAVGAMGKTGIVLSALAAVLAFVAGIALVSNVESAWFLFFIGFILLPAGMLLFGYATLHTHALPRWNALPLLIGVSSLVGLPIVLGLVPNSGGYAIVAEVVYLLAGVGWILLGVLIRSDTETSAAPSTATSV